MKVSKHNIFAVMKKCMKNTFKISVVFIIYVAISVDLREVTAILNI